MDPLQRKRFRQWLFLAVAVAGLVALVAWSALRPSPEEKRASAFVDAVSAEEHGTLTREQQEELRRQWQNFSPESRKRIFSQVARQRLDEFREKTEAMGPDERSRAIQKALADMRKHRQQIAASERARRRERLSSDEGKELVRNVLDFYQSELTARERADLDPLVHEWLYQVDLLMQPGAP